MRTGVLEHRIARDGTRHAVTATAASAEFRSTYRNDLDASLAQQRIGVGVAVVRNHHTGRQGNDIIAVVPLLPLCLPGIATSLDDSKLFEAECFFDYIEKMSFVGMNFDASVPGGTGAVAANRVDDFGEDRAQVAIAERKNGVEMHGCPALRHQAANHT